MVHNMKSISMVIILLLTIFLLPQGAIAAEVSLELSSNRAMPGNSISALGLAEPNTWVSLKILDSQQNIVLFDAVKSNADGDYQFIFVVPDLSPGSELTVIAGYGTQVVNQILTLAENGGGGSSGSRTTERGTASINPNQGGRLSLGSEVIIEIPANALLGNTEVQVKVQQINASVTLPADNKLLSSVYEFMVGNQSSYNFDQPIIIKLQFDPDLLGRNEIAAIHYYDESQSKWINIGGTVSDSIISAQVDHFTQFAVFSTPSPSSTALADIEGHWAAPHIKEMYSSGVIGGYPDGSFRPDNHITRAEFVTMLVKSFQLEASSTQVFADTAQHWARDYIAIANAREIVKGYSDTLFGPDDYITREQMAVMIAQAAQLSVDSAAKNFADQEEIAPWARDAVAKASSQGIINGYPDNSFKPKGKATRAEAVTVLAKSLDRAH